MRNAPSFFIELQIGENIILESEDHVTICKPRNRDSELYKSLMCTVRHAIDEGGREGIPQLIVWLLHWLSGNLTAWATKTVCNHDMHRCFRWAAGWHLTNLSSRNRPESGSHVSYTVSRYRRDITLQSYFSCSSQQVIIIIIFYFWLVVCLWCGVMVFVLLL